MPARVAWEVWVRGGGVGLVVCMSALTITTEIGLQSAIGEVREAFREHGRVVLTYKGGKTRSLDQNAISHTWYEQIARELREDDALGWKCYAKLHHGVPILRAEDAEFLAAYDAAIKGLTYEQKLLVMRLLPVTSLMTKKQLTKYLEAVQEDFRKRGVSLAFPEERAA